MTPTRKEPAAIYIPSIYIKLVLVGAAIFGIWYLIFRSSYFEIKQVIIKGTLNSEAKSVVTSAKGANIFTFDYEAMKRKIEEVYPEVYIITVQKGLPDTVRILATERSVELIWETNGKDYLVDKTGILYREVKTEQMAKFQNIRKIVDPHNRDVEVGKRVVGTRLVDFVSDFSENFQAKTSTKIKNWELGETSFQVAAVTDAGWRVYVDTTRSADYQLEDLSVIVNKHRGEILEYVDLRVAGYGYYK